MRVKIIERYIIRELLIPFVVIIVILAGLYASFISGRFLAGALTESLGVMALLKLVMLKTVISLDILMQLALYVAIVVGLGRLHRDQEINVLRSAGVSDRRIIYAVLMVAIPIGIIIGLLSIFVRPWAYQENFSLNAQAEAELNTDRFQAGRFYGSEGSGRVIYIQSKDGPDKQMRNVFHYVNKGDSSEIIVAKEGWQQQFQIGQRSQVHLSDGFVYRFMHSATKDTITQFDKLVYFTDKGGSAGYARKSATSWHLAGSDQSRDIAELQWRLSRPIGTILLALIAIAFTRSSPRQDKGERHLFIAAMVFAMYYILGGLAQTWVEQGAVGSLPGVWWLYALMLIAAFGLLSSSPEQRMLLRR